jgi:hypothetical protein
MSRSHVVDIQHSIMWALLTLKIRFPVAIRPSSRADQFLEENSR